MKLSNSRRSYQKIVNMDSLEKSNGIFKVLLEASRTSKSDEILKKIADFEKASNSNDVRDQLSFLSSLMELASTDHDLIVKILEFLKDNTERCNEVTAEHFVLIGLLSNQVKNETIDQLSCQVFDRIRSHIYGNEKALASMVDVLKTKIVPKMKEFADSKNFRQALSMWRAVIRFTQLKINTQLTNAVLHIATMAFKETDPQVHIEAFESWKTFIQTLAYETLQKKAYVKLVLNPLNRIYKDTDIAIAPHKFSVWWQLVLSLRDDIDNHFDDAVVPLLRKLFAFPSAKARQINPTKFINTSRQVPQEAYVLFALLLYNQTPEIEDLLKSFCGGFQINPYTIKDDSFAKHSDILEEIFSVTLHNIKSSVCAPPREFGYILSKVLLTRVEAFYDQNNYELVRLIQSTIYKLFEMSSFDSLQSLSLSSDIVNKLPLKVMISSQFNFRQGNFSMHECPVMSWTALLIKDVAQLCSEEEDVHKKQYRETLKTFLEKGTCGMNILHFVAYILKSLEDTTVFKSESWTEIAVFLTNYIKHSHKVNQGGSLEHDFNAIIGTLLFPFKHDSVLSPIVMKKWVDLFASFAVDAALLEEIVENQHIEELCESLLENFSQNEFDLHKLLLISQAFESIVKLCHLGQVPSSARKVSPLGNLRSMVKCIKNLCEQGNRFIKDKKQTKANSSFYGNILNAIVRLIRRADSLELCRELIIELVPIVGPLFQHSKNKAAFQETALSHISESLFQELFHFVEAFIDKAQKIPNDDKFFEIVRLMIENSSGHWKSGIREPIVNFAKTFSIEVEETGQSSQSLSQLISIPDAVPMTLSPPGTVSTRRSTKKSLTRKEDIAPPTRKITRLSASNDENIKIELLELPAVKKRSKKSNEIKDETSVTVIEDVAPKPTLFTEHQLEKKAETKNIPTMYEDLTQSSSSDGKDKPAATLAETAPVATQSNSKCSPEPTEERESSSQESTRYVVLVSDDENEAPSSKRVKTESGMPVAATATIAAADSSAQQIEKHQEESVISGESATNSPIRATGARKRKLGQIVESPIAAKLHKRFSTNSPSSRSQKLLAAARAHFEKPSGDLNSSMAGCTPRRATTISIVDQDTDNSPAPILESPPKNQNSILKKSEPPSGRTVSFSSNDSIIEVKDDQMTTDDVTESPTVQVVSAVEVIKGAVGASREQMLKYVSSKEFFDEMGAEERVPFIRNLLNNLTSFIR